MAVDTASVVVHGYTGGRLAAESHTLRVIQLRVLYLQDAMRQAVPMVSQGDWILG